MHYKLEKKIIFRGQIMVLSGLHIGGSNTGMEIGGINATVVRNPADNKPYIPGSSLKGKIRSLLELSDGRIGIEKMGVVDNGPCMDPNSLGARLFGNALNNNGEKKVVQRPSAIIFRDSHLASEQDFFRHTDLDYTQLKTEVVIDRITSKAMPRTMERVPAGAAFSLEIILNVFSGGPSESELVQGLLKGMRLLQDDYLGGHGSRGSGQVAFSIEQVFERDADWYLEPNGEGKDIRDKIDLGDFSDGGGQGNA